MNLQAQKSPPGYPNLVAPSHGRRAPSSVLPCRSARAKATEDRSINCLLMLLLRSFAFINSGACAPREDSMAILRRTESNKALPIASLSTLRPAPHSTAAAGRNFSCNNYPKLSIGVPCTPLLPGFRNSSGSFTLSPAALATGSCFTPEQPLLPRTTRARPAPARR